MDIFSTLAQGLGNMISSAWFLLSHGGWLLFLILMYLMGKKLYMDKINGDFIMSNKPVFLHIKIQKENLTSLLSVEQMFSNFHAMHTNFTFAETYFEGKINLWLSLEIVSIGGKISYIIRSPEKNVNLVMTSIYAHFPNAEISQVEDYMKNLDHWDHHHSSWDLWGTEFKMLKDESYPLKTWREFEHPTAEEPIIDPLAPMLEALSRAEAHELIAYQIIIKPIADPEWVKHSQDVVKELKEEKKHAKPGLISSILHFGGNKTLFEIAAGGGSHGGHDEEPKQPKVMRMTEGEKNVLAGIEMKMTKPGYKSKVRFLYIAPKDKWDPSKRAAMIGAVRNFGSATSNGLKPDVSGTWTNYNHRLFKGLEKPFVDFMILEKKHLFLKGFVRRSAWIGADAFLLNCEELATIYHFPLASVSTAPVERIEIKRGQPPANLPVMG